MRTLVALMLIAVALSGCADGSEAVDDCQADASCGGPIIDEDDLEKDKGLIRGIVVDDLIVPVEGATVILMNQDQETTTDAEGGFVFLNLEPGNYFLSIQKPGYTEIQQSVAVEAGVTHPELTRVQIALIPGATPFSVFSSYNGYIGCAAVMWIVFPNLCAPVGDPDQNEVLDMGTDLTPEILQAEIVWTQTQETGKDLGIIAYVSNPDGTDSKRVGNVWGPSPLVCTVTREAVCDNGDGTGGGGAGLNETGFAGGFRATVFPGCYNGCIIGAVGPGVVVQQKYSFYASGFFNHSPPEGWTLQEHGEYHPGD